MRVIVSRITNDLEVEPAGYMGLCRPLLRHKNFGYISLTPQGVSVGNGRPNAVFVAWQELVDAAMQPDESLAVVYRSILAGLCRQDTQRAMRYSLFPTTVECCDGYSGHMSRWLELVLVFDSSATHYCGAGDRVATIGRSRELLNAIPGGDSLRQMNALSQRILGVS
jgi:hypothetical protein